MSHEITIPTAGDAIRALREEAGLSLQQLADRVGWDKSRLSKYENNHLALALPAIDTIAHGLDLAPAVVVYNCLKHRYPALTLAESERGPLVKELVDQLNTSVDAPPDSDGPSEPRHLADLRGMGKHVWKDVDAREYVDRERDSWD